ncbi:MAG TPA: BON domain-containing protein [Acidimicrobiia bacterium]|nr:BON domain-containing protein [Acidimicrobiia bacterium]
MFKWTRRLIWGAVGAAVGYFFDPVDGAGRRARLRDQTAAFGRNLGNTASRKAQYQAGRAKGLVHAVAGSEDPPKDDRALLQKVRSEAVGKVHGEVGHIDVRVDDGVVYLDGQSKDGASEDELVARISDVTGVRDIRNQLVNG